MAVIAHPARYKFSANEEFALFGEFKGHGGRGVEVVTGSHTAAEYISYADTAREFGLAASRGSDFHSPNESHTELGTLPLLPGGLTRSGSCWPIAFRPPLIKAWGRTPPQPISSPMSFWRTQHGAGIALIVLAALAFAVLDTVTKYAVTLVPVLMLLWFRYAFQALLTLVLRFPVQRRGLFTTPNPRFQTLRGVLLLITSACSFFGLRYLPVGEFTAMVMLSPLVATALAAW